MKKMFKWIKSKTHKPKWVDLGIPILQKPKKAKPPIFHGNSHQRRVARRSWEREQNGREYFLQTKGAGSSPEDLVD